MLRKRAVSAAKVVLLNTLFSLIPPLMLAAFSAGGGYEKLYVIWVHSFVYSQCTGSLAWTILTPVMWRLYSEPHPMWVRHSWLLFALATLAVVGSMVGGLILTAMGFQALSQYWSSLLVSVRVSILITLAAGWAVVTLEILRERLLRTTVDLQTKELEHERALKLATEARLASLESRVHPHFLFNALNSISSLVQEDPVRAERLIERMSALLRFSLDAGRGLVPLEQEVQIVRDYLEIEKARFGDRLRYEIDVPESARCAQVPPLAVQSLAENSVKFAVSPSRTGARLRLRACDCAEGFRIEVLDDGPGFDATAVSRGHGLDNLQSRLAALFGDRAALHIGRQNGETVVSISVPGGRG